MLQTLLVNPLRPPLSADLFSAICYNNHFCSLYRGRQSLDKPHRWEARAVAAETVDGSARLRYPGHPLPSHCAARRCAMSLRPEPLPPIPDTTAAAVRAAFPKGNLYVDLRAEFGTLYEDQLFADLYPSEGRPVEVAPWRLALVMVMQYIEGLTDRQAADAVRRCMDWKYALKP